MCTSAPQEGHAEAALRDQAIELVHLGNATPNALASGPHELATPPTC